MGIKIVPKKKWSMREVDGAVGGATAFEASKMMKKKKKKTGGQAVSNVDAKKGGRAVSNVDAKKGGRAMSSADARKHSKKRGVVSKTWNY